MAAAAEAAVTEAVIEAEAEGAGSGQRAELARLLSNHPDETLSAQLCSQTFCSSAVLSLALPLPLCFATGLSASVCFVPLALSLRLSRTVAASLAVC